MKIIDDNLMNGLAEEAKKSPRLRKNYNFHQSLQDKCHRFLNALEPGTFIPVHHNTPTALGNKPVAHHNDNKTWRNNGHSNANVNNGRGHNAGNGCPSRDKNQLMLNLGTKIRIIM